MSIAIVLPTLNEEAGIGGMIDGVREASKGQWKIYVVDSGSSDRTVEIARQKKANIISLEERGKGIAIRKAFEEIQDDFLVLIDADMSYEPQDITWILEMLKECDIVLGSRFRGHIDRGAMSGVNRFGNSVLTSFANVLYGKKASDVCSGMWGFTKKAYKSMAIDAPHFELEANFFVQAAKNGLVLGEVPIAYSKRAGTSKLGIGDGFKIALYLIKNRILGP